MPVALEAQKCGICKFWKAAPEEAFPDSGLCRERPPKVFAARSHIAQAGAENAPVTLFEYSGHFPRTRESTWCGHWKESSPELLAINQAAKAAVVLKAAPTSTEDSQPSTPPAPSS